ncbi:MAG: adenylate/guanylate cyclase domain-containing protein [Hyphomicrobiaceae bacterium]
MRPLFFRSTLSTDNDAMLMDIFSPTTSQPGEVSEELAQEELTGLAYVFWGLFLVLSLLATWIAATLPIERSSLYVAAITLFAALGAAPFLLTRRGIGGTPVVAIFLLIDAAILSYILIFPNPYGLEGWSPQLNLRAPGFLYVGVFLVAMALSYKPALVIWAGIATITTWTVGYLWVVNLPDSVIFSSSDVLDRGLGIEAVISTILDPKAVGLTRLSNQIVFLALVTVILTLTVWRSRRLVRRQVAAEAQRSALSRYFSPNIVREISINSQSLDHPKVQPVAVLFADMVGFTAITERLKPDALVSLLREFHGKLADKAFAHGGTVDKYIGDAIMVNFGTPHSKPDDAVRALQCAVEMVASIEEWNVERATNGEPPIGIGVGVHFGDVIVGNIGDARRLEYTVLGDTVNVASRLEHLTRDLSASLVVSDDLIKAVRAQSVDPKTVASGLIKDESRTVRGRSEPIAIWRNGGTSLLGAH